MSELGAARDALAGDRAARTPRRLIEAVVDATRTRPSSKSDAANAKCVAATPSIRSRSPNGVSSESTAIEPKTVLTESHSPRLALEDRHDRQGVAPGGPLPSALVCACLAPSARKELDLHLSRSP
jgi:hypothetical protein